MTQVKSPKANWFSVSGTYENPSLRAKPRPSSGGTEGWLQQCPRGVRPSPFRGPAPEAPLCRRPGLISRPGALGAGLPRPRPAGGPARCPPRRRRAPRAALAGRPGPGSGSAPGRRGETRRRSRPARRAAAPGPGAAAAVWGRAGSWRRSGVPTATLVQARGAALLAAPRRRHERRAGRGGGGGRRRRFPDTSQGALGALLRDVLFPHRAGQQGAPQRLQVSAGAARAAPSRQCRAMPSSVPARRRNLPAPVPLPGGVTLGRPCNSGSRADSWWVMCWKQGRFLQSETSPVPSMYQFCSTARRQAQFRLHPSFLAGLFPIPRG